MKYIILLLFIVACSSMEEQVKPEDQSQAYDRINRLGPNKW